MMLSTIQISKLFMLELQRTVLCSISDAYIVHRISLRREFGRGQLANFFNEQSVTMEVQDLKEVYYVIKGVKRDKRSSSVIGWLALLGRCFFFYVENPWKKS